MPTAWRIVKTSRLHHAFDGEGARLFGGRWNSPGLPVVYTAGSRSLAALELLVHLGSSEILQSFSLIPVRFEQLHIETLPLKTLPSGWRDYPGPQAVRDLGDKWLKSGSSLVLQVPSVVIPEEANFLINPAHPAFADLAMGKAAPFQFDERLA